MLFRVLFFTEEAFPYHPLKGVFSWSDANVSQYLLGIAQLSDQDTLPGNMLKDLSSFHIS